MRADRLLSILMLLQARGRMSADTLARELEVSERTIYRDMDALCAAGVPVYSQAGREGGYALVDSYRTHLTGLTEGEVRALFMLSVPAPLMELGVSRELNAALWKLSAALPVDRRREQEAVRQRFYLDSNSWREGEEAVPHLNTVQQAVWTSRLLCITYSPVPTVELEQRVRPYGLVAKAGGWYLVAEASDRMRVFRVSTLSSARLEEDCFERAPGFDLVDFWKTWCAEREKSNTAYRVVVRVTPDSIPVLPVWFGERIRERIAQASPQDAGGWIRLELYFESLEAARCRLLAFGGAVQVVEPRALRKSIADYAAQIVALYAHAGN